MTQIQNGAIAQGLLRAIAINKDLKLLTTFDPSRGSDCTYLVEVVGGIGDVYAQGFGAAVEEAAIACWADWEK